MKVERRIMRSTPLLVAGAGAVLSVGCEKVTSGNLVAPPMVELCVDVTPEEARVTVDGGTLDPTVGCVDVYEGDHQVVAELAGYETHDETVTVTEPTTLEITLVPE